MVFNLPEIKIPILSGIILMMGGISMGLCLVYTSPTLGAITEEFHWKSMTGTMFNVCGLLSGMVAAPCMDFFILKLISKRTALFITSIINILSFVGLAEARVTWLLYLMRIFTGITLGFYSTICPVYLVEVAPPEKVGMFGYMNQLGMAIGFMLPTFFGMVAKWRGMTLLSALPSAILFLFVLFVPQQECQGVKVSISKVFKFPKQLLISFSLMFFLQYSGINAILSNLERIISTSGIEFDSQTIALIANFVQIAATLLASIVVDRLGRGKCWAISEIGQMIAFIILTCHQKLELPGWVFLVGLYMEQLTYGIGTGPIPFLLTAELFKVEMRSTAMAVMTGCNWFLSASVCFIWPLLEEALGLGYSFIFFAALSCVAIVFGYFCVKDQTKVDNGSDYSSDSGSEEITRRLSKHRETPDVIEGTGL